MVDTAVVDEFLRKIIEHNKKKPLRRNKAKGNLKFKGYKLVVI